MEIGFVDGGVQEHAFAVDVMGMTRGQREGPLYTVNSRLKSNGGHWVHYTACCKVIRDRLLSA